MTKINIAVDDGLPIPEAPPVTRAERPGFSSISFLRKFTVVQRISSCFLSYVVTLEFMAILSTEFLVASSCGNVFFLFLAEAPSCFQFLL